MNYKKDKNELQNNLNNNIKNIKNNDNNIIKENCPIINILQLNKNNKQHKKQEYPISPKKPNKNLRLPYMRLSQKKTINLKINTLLDLEPFYSDFNNTMDKKGKEILKEIACEYKDEKYEPNKIIFRYGDEADRFFIIYEGEVTLFFPFTESVDMNIDEFFVYILRLRRYNEIEMLNAVLLLNHGEFMKEFDEGFQIDNFIFKLYTTYLKLKFDPTFLYHREKSKKRKIKKINHNFVNNDYTSRSNNNLNNKNKSKTASGQTRRLYYYDENKEIDINIFDTFSDRGTKEMLLRIGDELIETMKWIMPDKMLNIVEEKSEDDIVIKKIKHIPEKLVEKYKLYNPNNINPIDYYKRILPIQMPNEKLISKKIIVMKYLYIDKLTKGKTFGDFNADSLSLFSHRYLNIAKNSVFSLNLHQHHHFRNMTAISTDNSIKDIMNNKIHLLSFNKKIYTSYFSKYIDRITFEKKRFLLNNGLFLNTNNKNLIRTYSTCFHEKSIKEGEYILKENEKLVESKIYVSFIINGEFQSNCTKTISQIDEILKIIGSEDKIKDTYSKSIKSILNTPFYDELIKKPLNVKLNYMSKNDIIGITEVFTNDRYFNNVICTGNNSKIYKVDARIIKLLTDSDRIVNDNKNIIIYNKYQMLSEILLKQRKIFFDSFINIDKMENIEKFINNDKSENNNKNNLLQNKIINFNYTPFPQKNTVLSSFDSIISQISPISRKSSFSPLNSSIIKKNSFLVKKNIRIQKKEKKGEDLDQMLASLSRIISLKERRMQQHLEFQKKYKEKMEILEKTQKLKKLKNKHLFEENIKYLKSRNKNLSFSDFHKSNILFSEVYKFLPLLNKKENKKYNSDYELVLPYESPRLVKSISTSEINPLFYDDFNRSFNTSQYFNIKCEDEKSKNKTINIKKDNIEYGIKFKSDIKVIKKPNQFIKNDKIAQRLINIYKGKFQRVSNDNNIFN